MFETERYLNAPLSTKQRSAYAALMLHLYSLLQEDMKT
jgi:hypothetical protein